jgi:hypothetical protein
MLAKSGQMRINANDALSEIKIMEFNWNQSFGFRYPAKLTPKIKN